MQLELTIESERPKLAVCFMGSSFGRLLSIDFTAAVSGRGLSRPETNRLNYNACRQIK
jgi:hypothetical protein